MIKSFNIANILKPKLSRDKFIFLFLFIVFCYNIIFSLQNLNMNDEGWVLTGYQQIFNDPRSVQYQFLYYLSLVVGGIWNLLFGFLGIWGGRLLTAIIVTTMAYLIFKLLEGVVNRWVILLGFIIGMCNSGCGSFHHNTLSAILAVISAYLLYTALIKRDYKLIFYAGVVLGINVFSRLPNLSLVLLILTLIPLYLYTKDYTLVKKMFTNSVLGFCVGCISILFLMLLFGHMSTFTEAIYGMFSAGGDPDSTHNMNRILQVYYSNYKSLIKLSLIFLMIPLSLAFVDKVISNKIMVVSANIIILFFSIFIICRYCNDNIALNAFVTTVLCTSIILFKNNERVVLLSLISLIIVHALPLGGDWGFANMGTNNMRIALPLSCGLLYLIINKSNFSFDSKITLKILYITFFGLFFVNSIKSNFNNNTYYEDSPRWEMTYLPKLNNINVYVDENHGKILEEVVSALNNYVKPNDYLLCVQELPLIHYITETKPYLGNAWIWSYDPSNLNARIKEAESEKRPLPVILCAKSEGARYFEYSPDWNRIDVENTYVHKNRRTKILNDFIELHHYKIVWDNDLFRIMIP